METINSPELFDSHCIKDEMAGPKVSFIWRFQCIQHVHVCIHLQNTLLDKDSQCLHSIHTTGEHLVGCVTVATVAVWGQGCIFMMGP